MGDNQLKTVLTNLAKDLVEMEQMPDVSEEDLTEITDVYSNVYAILQTISAKKHDS